VNGAPGRPLDDPEASGRFLFAASLLAGALLRLVQLGTPDLFGSDEGLWAVAARNLAEGGAAQLVELSHTPGGAASGIPALFPAMLSVMIRIFGPVEWAIRLPSAAAGLIGAFVLERIVRRSYGQPAGHLAGAFAALFPPLVSASRAATVEPTLVALGLGGVIFALRAFEEDTPWEGGLAGALFGLGFLAKGYAVLLFLGPALAALAARPSLFRLGRTRRSLALLLGSFVAVGSLQLLVTWLARPSLAGLMLASSFGASDLAARMSREPTAFGADLQTIVKTLFLFLPLAGVGLAYLARPVGENELASGATGGERRLAHGVLWGTYLLELLVIVAIAGRLRLSSVPVMPALAALSGMGGALLFAPSESRQGRRRDALVALLSGVVVMAAALGLVSQRSSADALDDSLFGGRRGPVSVSLSLAATAAAAAAAAVLASGRAGERLGSRRLAAAFVAALLLACGLKSARTIRLDLLTHRTGAREVADQMAPDVAALAPSALAFRAPEPDALAFRLYRSGRSWKGVPTAEALAAEARAGSVRFWAIRSGVPAGPSAPPDDVRSWLEKSAREVTGEVDARAGRVTGLRVFLPPAAAAPPPSPAAAPGPA